MEGLTENDSPITYGVVKPGDSGDVPFIRGGDISEGCVLHNQLRTITNEVSEQYRRTLLRGATWRTWPEYGKCYRHYFLFDVLHEIGVQIVQIVHFETELRGR